MRKFNRSTGLGLVMVAALLAAACGGGKDTATQNTPAATATSAAVPARAPGNVEVVGAGSTFAHSLYLAWFSGYNDQIDPGVKFAYQAVGSGAGIKSVTAGATDFGATDGFMSDQDLAASPSMLHIPVALGAVVPVYNVPGYSGGPLRFTGEVLADIYLGKIREWNDPRLQQINPGAALPGVPITVEHRSEGSGTTFIFTDYLGAVSAEWKERVGKGTTVAWPLGEAQRGNGGVAGAVKTTPGAIGYVDFTSAQQSKLAFGAVRNHAGEFVLPSIDSVSAAAAGAGAAAPDDLRVSIVDAAGATSYPISGFTWLLLDRRLTDPAKAQALTGFVWWALHDDLAHGLQRDLYYAPVPNEIVAKAEKLIRGVTVEGRPALTFRQ